MPNCPSEQVAEDKQHVLLRMCRHGAHDKIFSSHIVVVVLASHVLTLSNTVRLALFLWQAYIVLAARAHYSVDVVVACIVTELVVVAVCKEKKKVYSSHNFIEENQV